MQSAEQATEKDKVRAGSNRSGVATYVHASGEDSRDALSGRQDEGCQIVACRRIWPCESTNKETENLCTLL